MHKIFILLPVHNRCEITRRFVECLKSQTFRDYHLVLIDDGSVDGTAEMVQSQIESTTVIKGDGHWWWAGSLQQGYTWLASQAVSPTDAVLIINDDLEFKPDFLKRGSSLLSENPQSLVLAYCYIRSDGRLYDTGVHADWRRLSFDQATSVSQINCLSTRGLFLRISDFFNIGGFYPRCLPHYLSDYEFTIRAHRKGYKLLSASSLQVWLDDTATGYNTVQNETIGGFLKKYFSHKSMANPVAWTSFLLLACPWPWKPFQLIAIWKNAACTISQYFFKTMRDRVNAI